MRREEILVIGDVISIYSAYYLAAAGRHVTVVEKGEVCSGCPSRIDITALGGGERLGQPMVWKEINNASKHMRRV